MDPCLLSMRLREGTKKAHRAVENLAFLRAFLRGVMNLDSYYRYLIDLEHIYESLEGSLNAHPTHPLLRPLILPSLFRQPMLRSDIAFFSRQCHLVRGPSVPAQRYADRLRRLCAERPEFLIAHAYTRYLGDLSGGQILGRIAARALRLEGEAGLLFYSFPQIPDVQEFKREYRARLDGLPIDQNLAEQIVAEAIYAFALNGAVFKKLSGSAWLGAWNLLAQPRLASVGKGVP